MTRPVPTAAYAGLYVADRKTLAQHVPVAAGGRAADDAAVVIEQRLVAERVRIGDAVHLERHETRAARPQRAGARAPRDR